MKKILILFLLCCSLFQTESYCQKKKDRLLYDDLILHITNKGERFFTNPSTNKKFTGKALRYSEITGKMILSIDIKRGLHDGIMKEYTHDGKLKKMCKVKDTLYYDCKVYINNDYDPYSRVICDTDSVSLRILNTHFDGLYYNYVVEIKNENTYGNIVINDGFIVCRDVDSSGVERIKIEGISGNPEKSSLKGFLLPPNHSMNLILYQTIPCSQIDVLFVSECNICKTCKNKLGYKDRFKNRFGIPYHKEYYYYWDWSVLYKFSKIISINTLK